MGWFLLKFVWQTQHIIFYVHVQLFMVVPAILTKNVCLVDCCWLYLLP